MTIEPVENEKEQVTTDSPLSTRIKAIKGCPFDVTDFYEANKGLVKKYIRKNTYGLDVPDWDEVPDDWYYRGNSNILRANIKGKADKYTNLQKLEWIKCALDVNYFTKRHIKIISIDDGIIPFRLYDFQEDLLELYQNNRFVISMQCRQSGKTQTTAAYILWYIQFNAAKNCAILANKGSQAQEILGRVQLSYEDLPLYMQQGAKVYNKRSMEIENMSIAFSAASSSSSIRGKSVSLLYIDEAAFIPNDMEFYESTYPVIASGKNSQVIITSTPNGTRGLFYKLWQESEGGTNEYVRKLVTWDMVPGRDEAWKRQTISNTSPEQFRQEHECHFRGSQNSLLPGHVLETMVAKPTVHDSDDYRVYADPIKGHTYLMTVDVSRGLGKDYSAFSIVDVSTTPYEVVAVYQNNKISPMVFPSIISAWGWKYNDAYILVEINDIGEQVSTNLFYDLEYENLLMTYTDKNRQIIGSRNNPKTGVRTTTAVKAVGCSNIKTLIESGKLLVNDMETINEFGTFVPKGKSYEADSGAHDDLVMTMVLFAWATTQDYFIELTDSDVRASMQRELEARAEEELVPFGIIENDTGEYDGTAAMADIDFGGF